MEIKVLGTSGSDIPGSHLTSFLIDKFILLDAGGVTNSLKLSEQKKIKYIFITHTHLDHIRDIPFLADNLILSGRKSQITVFSIKEVIDDIKKHLLNHRLWPDFTVIPSERESILKLEKIEEGKCIEINGFRITPLSVNHSVPAIGYLIQEGQKYVFYTGDTGPTKKTWKKLSNVLLDALIVETSFPDSMKQIAKTTGHFTPELLIRDISLLENPPKKIYITHIKPFYKKQIKEDILKKFPFKVKILKGGETLRI
ncbi:MAG: 3',5'-cyclic-nucleotide phosphodiesterase [Thermoplasmata archaeon]